LIRSKSTVCGIHLYEEIFMRHFCPLVLPALVLVPVLSLAQAPAPQGSAEPAAAPHTMPPAPTKMPTPKWNPATVGTISGKLVGVWRSKQYGVVIGLDTEKDDVVLCSVGPAYFIDSKITFAAGDEIEATGSRVPYKGRSEMLVSVLKPGDLSVNIRSPKGKKLW
jgi:hypothetical protein